MYAKQKSKSQKYRMQVHQPAGLPDTDSPKTSSRLDVGKKIEVQSKCSKNRKVIVIIEVSPPPTVPTKRTDR